MRSNTYCGNLQWQSSLTRQAPGSRVFFTNQVCFPYADSSIKSRFVLFVRCRSIMGRACGFLSRQCLRRDPSFSCK